MRYRLPPIERRLRIINWCGGYRPFCACGWDDKPYETQTGAELAYEQHQCLTDDEEEQVSPEPIVTVVIDNVPRSSITDALVAIELADERGVFDKAQHDRLTALVLGLRRIANESIHRQWHS